MSRLSFAALLFGASMLFGCADDDPLVAVVDRIEVEVGGTIEFDPITNDIWSQRPDLNASAFDQSGVASDVADGRLLIRNYTLPTGSVVEVPYSIDLDGRTAQSVVVVVSKEPEPEVPAHYPFIDPPALDFTTVVLRDDAMKLDVRLPVYVRDVSEADLNGLVVSMEGPDVFTLVEPCADPTPECVVDVAFAPRGEGVWTGVVHVQLSSGESVGSVALAAAAVAEKAPPKKIHRFELERSTINLGTRDVGGNELSGTVTITNTGTEPLTLSVASSTNVEAKLVCPDPLLPSRSCRVDVFVGTNAAKVVAETVTVFAPPASRAGLRVDASVDEVQLPPNLGVEFDPAVVELDLKNRNRTVIVTNSGEAALRNVQVLSRQDDYAVAGVTCGEVLQVGSTCRFDVALTEESVDTGGSLAEGFVEFDATGFSERLVLRGDTTEPPNPEIRLEPDFIQFRDNNQPLGVTIENSGNIPLRGLRVSSTGREGVLGPFTVTNSGSCNGDNEIGPRETCRFEIQLDQLPAGFDGGAVVDQIDVTLGEAVARLTVQIGVVLR